MSRYHSTEIRVTPKSALVDDVISVHAVGLPACHDVTMTSVLDEAGKVFISHGHFVTSPQGELDLNASPSLGGTYTGVEPMGLLWSMKPADGQLVGLRLVKNDVTTPFNIDLHLLDGHVTVTHQDHVTSSKCFSTSRIYRYYKSESVRAVPVSEGAIRGMLFIPPGDGPFPAVIDMFGIAGGLIQFRAALLASRGFLSLALPYFDYQDLPKHMVLRYEYFLEAVDWLYSHPMVLKTSQGIGVVGVSKGATFAIQMAIMNSKVKAVVSINGWSIHHTGIHTYQGINQPLFEPTWKELADYKETHEGVKYGEIYKLTAENLHLVVPIEKATQCKFLFLIGEDDTSTFQDHVTTLMHRLLKAGLNNYKLLSYPGAGHLLEPPYTPHCRVCFTKLTGSYTVYGGETKAHSKAQEHAWTETLSFLKQELNPASTDFRSTTSATLSKL